MRRRDAGGAALHGEHVDGGLRSGEEAAEAQEGANCHSRRSSAILGELKTETSHFFFISPPGSHFLALPPGGTYQAVHDADVPLVLFEPQMHVLAHAVEAAQVGRAAHLPVALGNLWDGRQFE